MNEKTNYTTQTLYVTSCKIKSKSHKMLLGISVFSRELCFENIHAFLFAWHDHLSFCFLLHSFAVSYSSSCQSLI